MTALPDGTALLVNAVTEGTLGPRACRALRVPRARPAPWVPPETQDREETRVPAAP